MTRTPTLDPDRLDQLRSFLTAEAAAQTADSQRRAPVASRPRRLAVGAFAAMALSGVFLALSGVLAVSLLPGATNAALAITTEGEWTTVQMADIDADAQAVVDQLVAAGIDARLASQWDPNAPQGVGLMMLEDLSYGLSIVVPVGPGPTNGAEPAGGPPPPDPGSVDVVADDPDLFELHGVRTEGEDGSFSIRSGSDAVVLVHPRD